ncbi:MAG TPA: hypothetical protein VID70_02505, partial [Solirubrobacteraceae bacterium]
MAAGQIKPQLSQKALNRQIHENASSIAPSIHFIIDLVHPDPFPATGGTWGEVFLFLFFYSKKYLPQ